MGNAKGLVQVQMAHVNADFPGPAQSDQGIHIGTVHIDLPARLMDNRADFADGLFKHPVGRWIRHHQGRQPLAVCIGFRPQVRQVDIALVVTGDDDHVQTGHNCAGWIRSMRRGRNEADVSLGLPAHPVVLAHDEEAGVFALRTCIGLQRNPLEAGNFAQHVLQFGENRRVPLGLLYGRKRMQPGKFGPRNRHHFRGCIELHGTRAEGNHRVDQGQILGFEPTHVAHHFGLRVMRRKDGMLHKARVADVDSLPSRLCIDCAGQLAAQ